jgi:chloride channel 3/4/5
MRNLRSLSFKRKSANPSPFSLPHFFSGLQGSGSNRASRTQSPANNTSHPLSRRGNGGPSDSTDAILPYLDTATDAGAQLQDTKDANSLDWYVEGPGRRVGYDNLTAIDWIFEYAKERQRQRVLMSNTSGISGSIRQLVDASQIWLVLIATGIAAGCLAAFIDVASDWLADLKAGVCRNVEHGGKFYLSKAFCCWGMDGGFALVQSQARILTNYRNGKVQRLAALECSHARLIASRELDDRVPCLHCIFCKWPPS